MFQARHGELFLAKRFRNLVSTANSYTLGYFNLKFLFISFAIFYLFYFDAQTLISFAFRCCPSSSSSSSASSLDYPTPPRQLQFLAAAFVA